MYNILLLRLRIYTFDISRMPVVRFSSNTSTFLSVVRTGVSCICVLSLLFGCATDSSNSDEEQVLTGNILDEENLFDAGAELELSNFLDSLEEKTGIDFVLATVTDPGANGFIDYAASMTHKINPGRPGINNGVIIYLSDYSREVKVECGFGMEWYVSDTASGFVIERMRSSLVEGDYEKAAREGFLEIAKLASAQDWRIDRPKWTIDTISDLSEDMILQLTAKGIARAYQEGVPEATQFHPNYFIDVIHGTAGSRIYFSGYMRDLVDQIVYSEEPVEISCLVLESEPLRLGLLGVQ